ncbi:protein kinase domain-containing protein [Gordonia insulae]|uniref:non-specific serine/threonine protein kinase n=1 Tax=Gordonia insulae TaxID=2420509 RepID=A0A3G8JEU0_9ACTN|nr:protein kinase [Gordonia insulae]AZG43607.1 Serine/threonine-protein kinase PknH [Gordonia insulae]
MTGQSSRTGTVLGHYRIGTLLGRGGMGEVYRAFDTVRDREVALKLLSPHLVHDEAFRERFLRESRTAARLSEPHIIPIHDFGEIDGLLYLDMRLVNGRDLRKELRDGPLAPDRAVFIVGQVASALDAAHRSGLVHRDIKPDNILVDGDDFAYLVDFGIAHGATDSHHTVAGSALGSVAYMAPERFGDGPVGPPADIYALTCVLYECLTGAQPFGTASMQALMSAHLVKPPPTLGNSFDEVIARGMAKDPALRPPTARDLARAAAAAVATAPAPHRPIAAPPGPGPSGPTGPSVSGPAHTGPAVSGPVGPHTSGPATSSGPTWHTVSAPTGGPAPMPGGFGAPPPGRPPGPPGYGAPWSPGPPPPNANRGRTWGIVAAVASVVAIVAVIGIVVLTRGSADPPGPVTSTASTPAVATVDCDYRTTPAVGPTAPQPDPRQPSTGTVDVRLDTNQGVIGLTLDRTDAPCNVGAMVSLVRGAFYDNTTCHRLIGANVLLCGSPTGRQDANPGWASPDELPTDLAVGPAGATESDGTREVVYPRGTVGMSNTVKANRSGDKTLGTGAATFFMVARDTLLPPDFTVVGTVDAAGLSVLDAIAAGGWVPDQPGGEYGRPKVQVVIARATATP